MKKLVFLFPLLILAACGGGSSSAPVSDQQSTSPTQPPVPAPPPVPTPPPVSSAVFTVASGTATAVSAVGGAGTVTVNLSHQGNLSGQIYANVADSANVMQPVVSVVANKDNTHSVSISTAANIAAGHYKGTLTLNVCNDAACSSAVSGSPFQVPYDISITPEWQMFQGNAAHTAYVPLTLDPTVFKARWLWKSPSNYYSYMLPASGVVTGNGNVYFNAGLQMMALKEVDGTPAWNTDFSTLSSVINPPTMSDGKLYVMANMFSNSGNNASLIVMNANSGAILTKSSVVSQTQNFMPPTVSNGVVFSNWAGNGLSAFDGGTAAQKYFTPLQASDMWTPAVDANNVYTYNSGTSNYVNGSYVSSPALFSIVDRTTGAVKLSLTDPYATSSYYYANSLRSSPVIGAPNSVFLVSLNSTGGSNLSNINTSAGKWNWSVPGRYSNNPGYANGIVYAMNSLPLQIEARAETDGKLLWSWSPLSTAESSFSSDVLVTDSHVFVSTNVNTYAIDLKTHQFAWIYPMAGRLSLSANGVLYIWTMDNKLAAVALK